MAGLYSTNARDGSGIQNRATGSPFVNPVATVVPTGTPGDPNNAAWAQVSCSDGSLTDIYNSAAQQWNESGAAAAYADVQQNFEASGATSFSDYLANSFNARPAMSCETLDNPNCAVTVNCGQGLSSANAPVSAPAGYVLVNALVGLHNVFEDSYAAVNDIADQKKQKLIMDAVQGALSLTLAPMFHGGLARISNWAADSSNGDKMGTIIEPTYGMIGTAFAAAKDAMDSLSTLPIQNDLSTFVGEATKTWATAMQNSTEQIFNDPDKLLSMIDGGKTFTAGESTRINPVDAMASVEKALAKWSRVPAPVIITSKGVPQDGTGCGSYDPEAIEGTSGGLPATFNADITTANRVCDGDTAYRTVGAAKSQSTCFLREAQGPCPYNPVNFETLQGLETLNGTNFGRLTKEDAVLNAVNTWKAAGSTNGGEGITTFQTPEDVAALVDGDLKKGKGLVNIPVCSIEEVLAVTNEDPNNEEGNANYPCPA